MSTNNSLNLHYCKSGQQKSACTLQLCMAVWSDSVIRPVLVCSGKYPTQMGTNEKQRKTELTNNKMFSPNR